MQIKALGYDNIVYKAVAAWVADNAEHEIAENSVRVTIKGYSVAVINEPNQHGYTVIMGGIVSRREVIQITPLDQARYLIAEHIIKSSNIYQMEHIT